MMISIDFDNTIAIYDDAFRDAAVAHGLVGADFAGDRQALRDRIRDLPDGETAWMRLQGYIYGAGIGGAKVSAGFVAFARRMSEKGHRLAVVSHKTRLGHFDPLRIDLREAARGWMREKRLIGGDEAVIAADRVFFEGTRAEKVARIAQLSPAFHVDDLIEVFDDPGYPRDTQGLLVGGGAGRLPPHVTACADWTSVEAEIARAAAA